VSVDELIQTNFDAFVKKLDSVRKEVAPDCGFVGVVGI